MNYEMNTIELMAKTVWSDTTFITEVGKAAINGSLGEYNRYLFQEQTLSTLRVITSISQVQLSLIHILKLAWYGIEEPEDLRIKVDGYSVINAV